MGERADRMRQRYQDFSQGDLESALQDWADDFEWDGSNSDLPGGGVHNGKDQAVKVLQEAVGAWDSFELTADEFHEDGDTVIVLGHTKVTKGDQSGQTPVVLQILTDTYQAAQLLGKC
jgi:ketosteroid isomerase-like protein